MDNSSKSIKKTDNPHKKSEEKNWIRLQHYMAKSGVASRRKCEEFIAEGLVKVNGRTEISPGYHVMPEDSVMFRGKLLYPTKNHVYIALHKPPRYLCTQSDPENRPLAYDLLKGKIPFRLFNVGRLDFLSSGLIFFTNDGDFTRTITHPSQEIEKEYLVETREPLTDSLLLEFTRGFHDDGDLLKIDSYQIKTPFTARIVLKEGKNREIRRFFYAKKIKVKRIHRIRIGQVYLGNLNPGEFRNLTEKEVNSFLRKAK